MWDREVRGFPVVLRDRAIARKHTAGISLFFGSVAGALSSRASTRRTPVRACST